MRIQIIISHFLFTSWNLFLLPCKNLSKSIFTSEEKFGLILNFNTLSNGSVSLLTSTFWCILLPFWDCFLGLAPVALFWFFKRHLNEFVCNFWWFWNSWSADKLFETSVFGCLHIGQWPMTYLITLSDWTMSCQPWLPRARYGQWARYK